MLRWGLDVRHKDDEDDGMTGRVEQVERAWSKPLMKMSGRECRVWC